MANMNVAVLGSPGYARNLGKKGTESDITFYNLKKGDDTITFIEPSRYPERLASLFLTVSLSAVNGCAILIVDDLDAVFGESIVMLHSAGVKRGFVILRNYITEEQVKRLISGTVVENYDFAEDNPIELRERLLEITSGLPEPGDAVSGSVPVDHFFNVKGIGPVVLGCVFAGTIRSHDNLRVLPGEKSCILRSIQKHDEDFKDAGFGDRVGLALKNIDIVDLDRGFVLSTDKDLNITDRITVDAELSRYWPKKLEKGMILHIGHWLQYLPARVVEVETNGNFREPKLTLEFEKKMVYPPNSTGVITYLEGGKLRVAGTLKLN